MRIPRRLHRMLLPVLGMLSLEVLAQGAYPARPVMGLGRTLSFKAE